MKNTASSPKAMPLQHRIIQIFSLILILTIANTAMASALIGTVFDSNGNQLPYGATDGNWQYSNNGGANWYPAPVQNYYASGISVEPIGNNGKFIFCPGGPVAGMFK
jgi:hypothetical protein